MSSIDKKLGECLFSFQQIDQRIFNDVIPHYNNKTNQLHSISNQFNRQVNVENQKQSFPFQQGNLYQYSNHYHPDENNNTSSPTKTYPHQRKNKCHQQYTNKINNEQSKQPLYHKSYPLNGRNNSLTYQSNCSIPSYKHNPNQKNSVTDSTRITTGTIKRRVNRSIEQDDKVKCINKSNEKDNQLQWSFSPKLNNKTKSICNKLTSTSKERILMEKRRYYKNTKYNSPSSKSPYCSKSFYKHDKLFNPSVFIGLYDKGIMMQKNKRKYIEEIKQQRNNCLNPSYTYKPDIHSNYQYADKRYNGPIGSFDDFIQKNKEYEIKKSNKINQLKRNLSYKENALHSFTPTINNRRGSKDDVLTISYQVPIINDYISSLKQYRERERTKSKDKDYSYPLRVSKRKYSLSADKKKKQIKNIKNIEYYRGISPLKVLHTRLEFGLDDFFEQNCYSPLGQDICSKSLIISQGNRTMNSTTCPIDKNTSASIDY